MGEAQYYMPPSHRPGSPRRPRGGRDEAREQGRGRDGSRERARDHGWASRRDRDRSGERERPGDRADRGWDTRRSTERPRDAADGLHGFPGVKRETWRPPSTPARAAPAAPSAAKQQVDASPSAPRALGGGGDDDSVRPANAWSTGRRSVSPGPSRSYYQPPARSPRGRDGRDERRGREFDEAAEDRASGRREWGGARDDARARHEGARRDWRGQEREREGWGDDRRGARQSDQGWASRRDVRGAGWGARAGGPDRGRDHGWGRRKDSPGLDGRDQRQVEDPAVVDSDLTRRRSPSPDRKRRLDSPSYPRKRARDLSPASTLTSSRSPSPSPPRRRRSPRDHRGSPPPAARAWSPVGRRSPAAGRPRASSASPSRSPSPAPDRDARAALGLRASPASPPRSRYRQPLPEPEPALAPPTAVFVDTPATTLNGQQSAARHDDAATRPGAPDVSARGRAPPTGPRAGLDERAVSPTKGGWRSIATPTVLGAAPPAAIPPAAVPPPRGPSSAGGVASPAPPAPPAAEPTPDLPPHLRPAFDALRVAPQWDHTRGVAGWLDRFLGRRATDAEIDQLLDARDARLALEKQGRIDTPASDAAAHTNGAPARPGTAAGTGNGHLPPTGPKAGRSRSSTRSRSPARPAAAGPHVSSSWHRIAAVAPAGPATVPPPQAARAPPTGPRASAPPAPPDLPAKAESNAPTHDTTAAPAAAPAPAPAAPTIPSAELSTTPSGEAYERLAQVGQGTYGKVYKARQAGSGVLVALKRIRMEGEKDGFPVTSMREIKLLQSLRHENVVRLHEMMVSKGSVYMVMEYMTHDLTGVLAHPDITLSEAHIKSLASQMLAGLAYLHARHILHRDLKGSNILLSSSGALKLADFGLARVYHPRRAADYTNRVITLWYRAPELLLGETAYGPEVDAWSAGCIVLELFTSRPVFQGADEIDQLDTIWALMGTPDEARWPAVAALPWWELVCPRAPIASTARKAFAKWCSPAALDLVLGLLELDPRKRWGAARALEAPWFSDEPAMRRPDHLGSYGEHHEMSSKIDRQRRRAEK